VVQDARAYIVNLNNRLGSYELSLIVWEKSEFEEPILLGSAEELGE
jgi:hypothetical protein